MPRLDIGVCDDCYAYSEDHLLVVGNSFIERRWSYATGFPIAVGIFDKASNTEWIAAPELPEPIAALSFGSAVSPSSCVSSQSLTVFVNLKTNAGELTHELAIYPRCAAIVQRARRSSPHPGASAPASPVVASGIEHQIRPDAAPVEEVADTFTLLSPNTSLKHVTFIDRTDIHNELLHESIYRMHHSEFELRLDGNLFAFDHVLKPTGLAFLKLAPLPDVRPAPDSPDIVVSRGRRVDVRGLVSPLAGEWGYRCASLVYDGSQEGLTRALHALQRRVRNYEPGRDGLFITNTWGDRGQDGRVNERFIAEEIAIAHDMGVDVVQIDDGWQAGTSANSVLGGGIWEGFQGEKAFWRPHPQRFPNGLEPLVREASKSGMGMGLWFAPDSANDFENWRIDADTLLDIHRNLGIDHFKLDGIKLRTPLGEQRLHRFLTALRDESGGKIACDLDVTAETRPGYFGAPETGPLFVENRYTDAGSYLPHATLRNLWKLARYIDPVRLRIELLNNERNAANYGDNPLAPANYDPAYLFAITMVASPLGWFESTRLSPAYRDRIKPLVALWRKHREELRQASIFPIGEAPDGAAWTGFIASGENGVHDLIVFRELNNRSTNLFSLPSITARMRSTMLFGDASVETFDGGACVTLERPLSFVWARIN